MLRIMDAIRATHRERAAPVGSFGTVVLAYLHDRVSSLLADVTSTRHPLVLVLVSVTSFRFVFFFSKDRWMTRPVFSMVPGPSFLGERPSMPRQSNHLGWMAPDHPRVEKDPFPRTIGMEIGSVEIVLSGSYPHDGVEWILSHCVVVVGGKGGGSSGPLL